MDRVSVGVGSLPRLEVSTDHSHFYRASRCCHCKSLRVLNKDSIRLIPSIPAGQGYQRVLEVKEPGRGLSLVRSSLSMRLRGPRCQDHY